ncbi:MAG: LLM class flavin-dependent oxidoreductase, partial [Rhodospirillaceae bacterium]|nr:LLM class flavin-dependent oxidoreductase [Rhodospirillaceae bacterium]
MSKPRLSVLDQSPIRTGGSPAQAIGEMLELAQLCDRLGYHRYWLAEHHGSPALAGSSPEILTARVAGLTERIRVGAGGVMLTHYAPLKVAENFRMLEALFPGRIDLALGRAPGGDQRTNKALTVGPVALGIEHYSQQIQRLLEFLDQHATGERDRGIHAQPVGPDQPEVWLLGSSIQSALYAAELGLPYSFAHFINHHDGREIMEAYRRQYCPSETAPRPQASIGVFVICAETQGEADFLALSREGLLTDQRTGFPGPVPEPAAVRDRRFTPP